MHRHLLRLTPLRYLAALTVVVFHFGQDIPPFDKGWLHRVALSGDQAVVFFFCLSGFIMATVYGGTTVSARDYWIARIARLYPLYLLSGIAVTAFLHAKPLQLLLQIFMLQSWVPGYALSINKPAWSLSVEAFFYILFPFLIPQIGERGINRFAVFSLALWAATQVFTFYRFAHGYDGFPSRSHDLLFYFPPMHLHEFLLGVAAGVLFGLWNRGRPELQRLLIGIAVLGAGLGLKALVAALAPEVGALTAANGLGAPVFIGVIWLVASLPEGIAKPLEWRPLVILGEASYAVYLLQYPAKLGFDRFAARVLDAVSPTGRLFLFAAALTAVSVLVYACIERPARRLIRRGFQAERAASASQAI